MSSNKERQILSPIHYLFIISYDGHGYCGWQETGKGKSIEGELTKALNKLFSHPIKLQAASRTDAGVHALGQAVSCLIDIDKRYSPLELRYRLNRILPNDILIKDIVEKPIDFHPTLDALGKTYLYKICTHPYMDPFLRRCHWHFPNKKLDVEKMLIAAKHFEGTHDFSAFCNQREDLQNKEKNCTIRQIAIMDNKPFYHIYIKGDRFLYRMARNLAGTLCYIGADMLDIHPNNAQELFKKVNRSEMGITAPSHGLFLEKVHYNSNYENDLIF